jgi:hypothetical protein
MVNYKITIADYTSKRIKMYPTELKSLGPKVRISSLGTNPI